MSIYIILKFINLELAVRRGKSVENLNCKFLQFVSGQCAIYLLVLFS